MCASEPMPPRGDHLEPGTARASAAVARGWAPRPSRRARCRCRAPPRAPRSTQDSVASSRAERVVVSVQPWVVTRPSRASTAPRRASLRTPRGRDESQVFDRGCAEHDAVGRPRERRRAPARRCARRRPPARVSVAEAREERSIRGALRGAPSRAPSRSTMCARVAPRRRSVSTTASGSSKDQ
jgi:hypothetical protein